MIKEAKVIFIMLMFNIIALVIIHLFLNDKLIKMLLSIFIILVNTMEILGVATHIESKKKS